MIRELAIASTIGSLGVVALVFGVQGYFNPDTPFFAPLADPTAAAVAISVGLLCCMLEVRLLVPILKDLAAQKQKQR